ncbi:hypothetical protein JCGZ_21754 [Jatropha curcas]|uniref:Formin-like protein n=1 Tax=Jatropha curcas TaxID=180498 RepID=A0A067JEV7_JATCU|nr:formin-like protein 8 [Jatropha curcas]KDP21283.1 hypothetical protein JCGZ_21754 [Jatropha curcas]
MNRPLFFLLFFISVLFLPFSSSQSNSQNIETFYPSSVRAPSPSPSTSPSSSPSLPPSGLPLPPEHDSSSDHTVAKAVAATAASTFVIATLLFFFIQRYILARRRRKEGNKTNSGEGGTGRGSAGFDDDLLRSVIIDENGLDVVYWKRLQEENKNRGLKKLEIHNNVQENQEQENDEETVQERNGQEPIQEIPLLRGKSTTSQNKVVSVHPPMPPPPPPRPPPVPIKINNSPPPPPPPPPIPARNNNSVAPAPPPIPAKKVNAPPPPPPHKSAKGMGSKSGADESSSSTGEGNPQVKLRPLHWDKVNRDVAHSMVWDRIGAGSFRVDDDLMEALFGYVATNRKSPKHGDTTENRDASSSAQITLLDPRKSQNIAIVLKSLGVRREEILDALADGKGLNADTLEKLMRIAPAKEEESLILEFEGDPNRLADAENFLYHILNAVPSAFTRLNAFLFRINYDFEILQFKESLQTLELACKELRNRGLFMKLLEAILKAGNRMNAGTSRGNAQAFNLTSLRKLSDVKSSDGKTTLLHFIVEEVVRSEGKRCVLNRSRSLSRSSSISSSSSSISSANLSSKEEREREYKMLGLPMVGGLSSEFSNVKRAAQIDYEAFAGTCSALTKRIAEIRLAANQCAANGEEGFAREMKGFLEAAEEEIKVLRSEQIRIMNLVQKTTEYYQAGASKNTAEHQLQLFIIIKDFLGMVDNVCIEIARNLQKRRAASSNLGSSPRSPPAPVLPVRFPNLPEHFMKEKSSSSSSESDSEF